MNYNIINKLINKPIELYTRRQAFCSFQRDSRTRLDRVNEQSWNMTNLFEVLRDPYYSSVYPPIVRKCKYRKRKRKRNRPQPRVRGAHLRNSTAFLSSGVAWRVRKLHMTAEWQNRQNCSQIYPSRTCNNMLGTIACAWRRIVRTGSWALRCVWVVTLTVRLSSPMQVYKWLPWWDNPTMD